MSNGLIALLLGIGVSGWAYAQLAKRNGNANLASNALAAAAVGFITAVFLFTLLRYVLNFK